jgi:hypothetical protein
MWFGPYGFTSLVINNNIENLIILCLLIVKIGLLKLISKLIGKETTKKLCLHINEFVEVCIKIINYVLSTLIFLL